MKKITLFLATAMLTLASCSGLGINPEANDPGQKPNPNPNVPVDPKPVPSMDNELSAFTPATDPADTENKVAKETMAQATKMNNILFSEVVENLKVAEFAPKAAAAPARSVADLPVPHEYDAENDILTINYGATPVDALCGLKCAGMLKVYNASFFLLKDGKVSVQTTSFQVNGMVFMGQMDITTKELLLGIPTKLDVEVKKAFIKSGFNIVAFNGSMSMKLLTDGIGVEKLNVVASCIFGQFKLTSDETLKLTSLDLPVSGGLKVAMCNADGTPKKMPYDYKGEHYEISEFSIVFDENVADIEFGLIYREPGMDVDIEYFIKYGDIVNDYPEVLATIGVYMAALGIK